MKDLKTRSQNVSASNQTNINIDQRFIFRDSLFLQNAIRYERSLRIKGNHRDVGL